MDTSEAYIKMCEKAEEIQKLSPIQGEFGGLRGGPSGRYLWRGDDVYSFGKRGGTIWLPRQDQLQEMVNDWIAQNTTGYTPTVLCSMYELNRFYENNKGKFRSYEQLWLAFVMKEKYDKTWDGDKWLKEETPQ